MGAGVRGGQAGKGAAFEVAADRGQVGQADGAGRVGVFEHGVLRVVWRGHGLCMDQADACFDVNANGLFAATRSACLTPPPLWPDRRPSTLQAW